MIRWRDLSPARQAALQISYAAEMARQARSCDMNEKIARFAAWLAPQGISFAVEDLPAGRR
ncbi:hypothetical protein [Rhodobacter sp. TJ_12]|uniref:hypothetical protein n=1 Tax=Rhodobacter sp. TJ_12 TaxID=2029399 RepID=UPI001CBA7281|nr:hypothetical protein [Rhodobacter sp. TJ_12]